MPFLRKYTVSRKGVVWDAWHRRVIELAFKSMKECWDWRAEKGEMAKENYKC